MDYPVIQIMNVFHYHIQTGKSTPFPLPCSKSGRLISEDCSNSELLLFSNKSVSFFEQSPLSFDFLCSSLISDFRRFERLRNLRTDSRTIKFFLDLSSQLVTLTVGQICSAPSASSLGSDFLLRIVSRQRRTDFRNTVWSKSSFWLRVFMSWAISWFDQGVS